MTKNVKLPSSFRCEISNSARRFFSLPKISDDESILIARKLYRGGPPGIGKVVVDMSLQNYCSLAVVGVLADIQKHFSDEPIIQLRNCPESIKYVISVSEHKHNFEFV